MGDFFDDLTQKWDEIEDKRGAVLAVGLSLVGIWIAFNVVGALDKLPVVPKLMQIVGFVYTCWFVYTFLLFKEGREELGKDVEELKKKVSGGAE